MRKTPHWYLGDLCGITNTGSWPACLFTQVAVFRHIGKPYLSKIRHTSSLDLYLWLILAVKRTAYCEQSLISSGFPTSTTATRSWDEGSIFTLSFALIWWPVVVLCSDSPPSAKLSKNFHESALCRTVKHFTIGCKQRRRNWQKTRTGQSLKTPGWKHPFCSAIDFLP